MMIELFSLLFGVFLLIYCSPKVVSSSSALAKIFKISPLLIGMLVVGIGTSIPEISNSIISSLLGHGDINVGNAIGSSISQITLILGLCVLTGGLVKTKRDDVLVLGCGAALSAILGVSIIIKGVISQLDGLLLMICYIILVIILRNYIRKGYFPVGIGERVYKARKLKYCAVLALSLSGVIIGSYALVDTVIIISESFGLPEFIISFLAIGISTSLPELVVGVSAVRRKEYELLLGDIFGSNMVDLTLSLGAGPVLAANILSGGAVRWIGLYLIMVTLAVTALIAWRKKIDKKTGVLFILLYFASIPLLTI